MPLDALPLPTVLNRTFGINLERAIHVDLSTSIPVMLFFQKQNDSGSPWLVPVTRFVPRTADRDRVVLEQLLAGPLPGSELATIFPTDIRAESVSLARTDDMLTIDWAAAPFPTVAHIPDMTRAALALSLTAQNANARIRIQLHPALTEPSAKPVDAPAQTPTMVPVQVPVQVPDTYNVWQ
jgi:germination protein M